MRNLLSFFRVTDTTIIQSYTDAKALDIQHPKIKFKKTFTILIFFDFILIFFKPLINILSVLNSLVFEIYLKYIYKLIILYFIEYFITAFYRKQNTRNNKIKYYKSERNLLSEKI